MAGVHENMVDYSTAAETKVTKEHKQTGRNPEKTRAQKDAHNASCQRSRLKAKRRREDLEAMVPQLQAENKRMKAEIERMKAKQGIEIESQELRRALEIGEAIVEQMKQIPCAWKVDGTNFTSFDEAETWILSQTYDQGLNDTNNNTTASAAAGPSCVANHGLPNNPDNNPFSHDPATGNKAGFPTAPAAGSIFVANPESAFAFAAPYNRSTSDLCTDHDLAAGTNGANITAFAAFGPSFPNHGLPNNAPENNSFNHDPAPAAGVGSFFAADPELDIPFYDLENLVINDLFTDDDLAAAGSSLIAGHKSPVMFDAPTNHDTINNHSTHDPAAGFSTASAAGSSSVANHNLHARKSYDISSLFTHHPAANNKAGQRR